MSQSKRKMFRDPKNMTNWSLSVVVSVILGAAKPFLSLEARKILYSGVFADLLDEYNWVRR